MPILRILCYNGNLVTWTAVSLTTAELKPLVFSMSGFALSCTANAYILIFCMTSACCLHSSVIELYTYGRLSESESESLYDWQFTANQFVLVTSSLRLTASNFFSQMNSCYHSHYVTSTLKRGWVCRSQLLLAFTSAVILRSESRGTHDQILLSKIRDSPQSGGPGPPIYIPQEHGRLVIPPGTGFHFRRLLRLAGLRWRYSTSPPHGTRNIAYNTSARTT
jgi:hypothetical protein